MGLGLNTKFEGAVRPDAISVDSYESDLYAKRVTDIPSNMQKRLDYQARTDSNAVYIGSAPRGLSEDSDGWLLYYLEYDSSDRLTKLTVAYNAWSNRISATYA